MRTHLFFLCLRAAFLQRLRERAFWMGGAALLLLSLLFSLLCPAPLPAAAAIGLCYDGEDAALAQGMAPLLTPADGQQQGLTFVYYPPAQAATLRQDVLRGALHCGYVVTLQDSPAITAYHTRGAVLAQAADELVFAAYYRATLPDRVAALRDGLPLTAPNPAALWEQAQRRAEAEITPMQPVIAYPGFLAGSAQGLDLAPLLLACLAAAFLWVVCLAALCQADTRAALARLAVGAAPGMRAAIAAGAAVGGLLPQLLLLGAALLPTLPAGTFAAAGSFAAFWLGAALLGAALRLLLCRLRPSLPLLFGLTVWLCGSVALSGALFAPSLLGTVGWLQWLSPCRWLLWLL